MKLFRFPSTRPLTIIAALTAPTMILSATNARAEAPLAVEASISLPEAPARVWARTGDFGRIDRWYPGLAKVEITRGKNNVKGAHRLITLKEGATIEEELLEYKKGKQLRYRIVASPLPVKDYVSTFQVKAEDKGSRVIWSSTFQRDPAAKGVDDAKAKEIIAGVYDAGLKALAAPGNSGK